MPLDGQELNSIYDINDLGGPGPKPVAKAAPKTATAFDISKLGQEASPVQVGSARPTDVEDYGKYLDQGVFSDQDIDSQRGQHQSVINKIGHALGNLPGNIIGSFMEGIGDLGLLAGQWGDDRTYTNALIEAGQKLHNLTGEIYMRNPHATAIDTLSDPSWWIDQVEGLAEFGVSYAALGAGIGGSMSKLAEGTAGLIKAGEAGVRTGQALGQLGTAGFMSYTMGAQSAGQVFKSTYETQFQKMINAGADPEDAKKNATHIAAQSAATTAQITTAIGTVLALGSMAPYFRKSEDVALDILKKKVPQQAGESVEDWANRVRSESPDEYHSLINPSASVSHKLLEMGKMGVEMQQLQFGQKTGEDLGKKGKTKGFIDQFDELANYFDRTMDKDGALAFGIGAVSGLGIDFLRNNVIPSKWADKIDPVTGQAIPKQDADGNVIGAERKLYTPKTYSELHTALKFTNMKDAIASDIDQYSKMQQAYLAAVKSKDPVAVDRAGTDMFNINNISAITSGMGDVWKSTYDGIANMSPEEAHTRGFTSDPNDTSYQDKATKGSANLDKYQKMYDDLTKKYGTDYASNQGFKPVIDSILSRKIGLDSWDQMLKEHETKLAEMNKEDFTANVNSDVWQQSEVEYGRTWQSTSKSIEKLKTDHTRLTKGIEDYNAGKNQNNNLQTISAMAREYSAIDPDHDGSIASMIKAANNTSLKIQTALARQGERLRQAQDNLFNSTGYNTWSEKHPDKPFSDYVAIATKQAGNIEYQHQIELSREKYNIAKQNLSEVDNEKGIASSVKKYQKYMEMQARESEALDKAHNAELATRAKDTTAVQKIRDKEMNEMASRYLDMRDKYDEHVKDNKDRLETAKKELEVTSKDIVRKMGLRSQIRKLEKQIASDTAKLKKYDTLYNQHKVFTPLHIDPINTDDVTINPPLEPNEPLPAHVDPIDPAYDKISDKIEVINPDINALGEQEARDAEDKIASRQLPIQEAEANLLNELTEHMDLPEVMDAMNQMQNQIIAGQGFSFDMLKQQVADKLITQEQASRSLLAMKEYAEALKHGYETADLTGYSTGIAEVIDDEPESPIDVVMDMDAPSDPAIISADEISNAEVFKIGEDDGKGGITFAGAKTVEANTIANSTLGYWEFAPDHNKEINLVSQKDQQNLKTNPDVLKAGKLSPGTRIKFVVDTEYDGPKNLVGQLKQDEYGNVPQGRETFQDYVDEKGKIPADKMANVPIKIVDEKGKTIGYVRKHEWVTEKYNKGTTGLRNIAERFDDDGNEINGALQSKRILDIRKAIVDSFNAGAEPHGGSIINKGVGHPILNMKVNINSEKARPTFGYAFNHKDGGLLPDPKLIIAISDNGTLKSGRGYVFDKPVAGETKDIANGQVMVMLPGANGQHIPAPLAGKSLGENESHHRTISRAIELYLQYTGSEEEKATHEIRKLQDKTGFDLSTEKGLRSFLNQYFTYTQRFDDTATATGSGQSQFLFNVWDKIPGKEGKGWIKAAFSKSGQKPVYASLDADGKLNQQFSDVLKEGLSTRSKSVVFTRDDLRGINEPRNSDKPFVDALYNSKGNWVHNEYKDYNEYVKSFSKTTAYGKNKLADGSYVYTANPTIGYKLDGTNIDEAAKPTLVESNKSATRVNIPEEPKVTYNKSLADEMDDIFNAMPRREQTQKEIGTGDPKSKPLNLKNLEDLYTFTPEDQRNGKVPSDILKELSDRGHSFIPDGYNPFSLCL